MNNMKRINLTFVVAAGLAFASFGATDLRELTFQVAVPCETAPVIDGAMDDACWAKAPAHTTYYQYYIANPPATNGYADCRIVYDQKGLYMAVRNPEPLMSKVKPKHVKNFDGGLWYDESAEIYFDPAAAGVGWYKFIVNCLGKHDTAYQMDPSNVDEKWVAKGIASAAKMFDDRWEFELYIPWTVFDNHPPARPGEMWTCLHARFRWLEHPWKDFFATASGAIGGYSPNLFGYLYFSDGQPVPPKRILDILTERVHCRWAVQIGDKTYMHDERGVSELPMKVSEYIAQHEREDKAVTDLCRTNVIRLATEPDFRGKPLKMPLAGKYDLNPPKEYNGHNGWYRHNPVRNAYVTPHLEWAPKLLGKSAPRVWGVSKPDTSIRELVELDQRYCFEDPLFQVGIHGASGHFETAVTHGSAFDMQAQTETLLAKNPDVICLSRIELTKFPPRYLYEILRRVRDEGVGLVILTAGDVDGALPKQVKLERDPQLERAFAQRAPGKSLPGFKKLSPWDLAQGKLPSELGLRMGRFGKGRVAVWSFPPPVKWSLRWKGMFESRTVMPFNLIRWAQGADPATTVDYGTLNETLSFGAASASVPFAVDVGDSGVNEVRYRVRDDVNRVVYDTVAPLRAGRNLVAADISKLPPGDYYLDVMPRRGDLYDLPSFRCFAKEPFVAGVTIAGTNEVVFVQEGVAPNFPIEWKTPYPDALTVSWTLRDLPYNQVRAQGRSVVKPGATKTWAGDKRLKEFPTRAGVVRVDLADAQGRPVGAAEKVVYFPNHRYPDYTMIMWASTESGNMAELFMPQMVDWMGYDSFVEGDGREAAHFNSWLVPSVNSLRVCGDARGSTWTGWIIPRLQETAIEREQFELMKSDYNIYRPEVKKTVEECVRRRFSGTAKWAPIVYGLGDESWYSGDLGMGDAEDDRIYREWLEKRYKGDIARFNKSYKTNLASFAEAPHIPSLKARETGNLSAWLDTMLYSAHYYADASQLQRAVVKKLDPRARVGHEASSGGDLEYTLDFLDFWGPYRDVVSDELCSSVKPQNLVRAVWWGGYVRSSRNGFPVEQWEYLLTGTLNGDEWFCGYPGSSESCFAADLTPAPYVQRQHAYHVQLKRGLASLLMRTPLRKHPIAHGYSWPSAQLSVIDERYGGGDALEYVRFCYRHGYGVNFVPRTRPRNLDGAKLLNLSGCHAMTDEEVANVKAFLARGGKIVSTSEPGVLDDYLALRETPPFAGKWTKLSKEWTDAEMLSLVASVGVTEKERVEGLDMKHTILRCRDKSYAGKSAETFGAKMTLVGFKTLAENVGKSCAVDLGGEGFVYETDDRFLGALSRVEIAKLEKPFKLYSVFAKEQPKPAFALDKTEVTAGEFVTFKLDGLRPDSTYRLMVLGLDGKEIVNRTLVFCADGREKQKSVQFPYSDKSGVYRLALRDIATGLESSVEVKVL